MSSLRVNGCSVSKSSYSSPSLFDDSVLSLEMEALPITLEILQSTGPVVSSSGSKIKEVSVGCSINFCLFARDGPNTVASADDDMVFVSAFLGVCFPGVLGVSTDLELPFITFLFLKTATGTAL